MELRTMKIAKKNVHLRLWRLPSFDPGAKHLDIQ